MTGARIRATLLAAAVTAAVIYGLLALADPAALIDSLSRAAPAPLIAAFLIVPVVQWLRAWRFSLLMSGSPRLPDRDMVRAAALLNFFNFLLPFRVGEASFPILMKRRYGMEYARAAGMLVLARLMDACAVGALLCVAAAATFDAPLWGWGRPTFITLGVIAAACLLLLPYSGEVMRSRSGSLLSRWPRIHRLTDGLMSGGAQLRGMRGQLSAIGLTLGIWASLSVVAILAIAAVDPTVGVAAAMTASAANNLAFALPITGIAGLGPAQAAWATTLNLAGTPWDTAIASALAGYAIILSGALAVGGLALLMPASRERHENQA